MVDITIPGLQLVSEANWRGHWATKARRVSAQRNIVTIMLATTQARFMALYAPLTVVITRIAPRRLDSDNAVGSAKAVRDAIAQAMKVSDGNDSVDWRVDQAKGPVGVRIQIYPRELVSAG